VSRAEGFAAHGDEIVVTAGVPFGHSGTTNALRVASVK
jgi:pyruvate kinase